VQPAVWLLSCKFIATNYYLSLVLASVVQSDAVNCNTIQLKTFALLTVPPTRSFVKLLSNCPYLVLQHNAMCAHNVISYVFKSTQIRAILEFNAKPHSWKCSQYAFCTCWMYAVKKI